MIFGSSLSFDKMVCSVSFMTFPSPLTRCLQQHSLTAGLPLHHIYVWMDLKYIVYVSIYFDRFGLSESCFQMRSVDSGNHILQCKSRFVVCSNHSILYLTSLSMFYFETLCRLIKASLYSVLGLLTLLLANIIGGKNVLLLALYIATVWNVYRTYSTHVYDGYQSRKMNKFKNY